MSKAKKAKTTPAIKTAEPITNPATETHNLEIKDRAILKRFLGYSLKYKKILILALFAIPILTSSAVLVPWIVVQIGDQMLIYKQIKTMNFWISILLLLLLISIVFEFIYSFSLQYIAQRSIMDARIDLFSRVIKFPKTFFDQEPLGKILSRFTSDFENVQESLAIGVLTFIVDLIKTIFLLVVLFLLNLQLAIVVLLFFPLMFFITQIIRKLMREAYIIARKALAQAAAYLGECIQGMQTVQLYLAEEKAVKHYHDKNMLFFQKQKSSNWYESFLFSFIESISIICVIVILWYAADLSLKNLISISVIIAFLNALQKCFIPIRELFQQVSTIQRALSSLNQIEALFRQEIEIEPEFKQVSRLKNLETISFKNVSFRYPSQKSYALKNVSFEVKKKEKFALVGATGSGKSTILRILAKQYQNYEGSIKINNIELSKIPREVLTKLCSIQFQDVYLFNENIAFNIALNQKKTSLAKTISALKYVDAWNFVKKLKGNLKFIVSDNGKNLSAGQGQLISLARVVAQEKELFLLDEATSAVDSLTTKKIDKAIEKIFMHKTVIAIAHQISTIQKSDVIVYLKNGSITERGSHKQLLALKGGYASLVNKLN